VWCGQLKTGPDNFVWEFLPLGVEHKDAPKFRDILYNQGDPISSLAFINVNDINGDCGIAKSPIIPTPPPEVGFIPIITQQPEDVTVILP